MTQHYTADNGQLYRRTEHRRDGDVYAITADFDVDAPPAGLREISEDAYDLLRTKQLVDARALKKDHERRYQNEVAAREEARQTAIDKLTKLGLTVDEASAIGGL